MRLRQILNNLIGNAIKFTSTGEIVVEVSAETVSESRSILMFTVTDTGIGIAEDKLDMLFEAFTQADSSTTRKYGGTGLGLTISKNIANLMGGDIGASSKEGSGSTFWFKARFKFPDVEIKPHTLPLELLAARTLIVAANQTTRHLDSGSQPDNPPSHPGHAHTMGLQVGFRTGCATCIGITHGCRGRRGSLRRRTD